MCTPITRYELADGYKAEKFYSINMSGEKIEYRLNVDYSFNYYDSIIYYLIIEEQTNWWKPQIGKVIYYLHIFSNIKM